MLFKVTLCVEPEFPELSTMCRVAVRAPALSVNVRVLERLPMAVPAPF